MNDEQFKERFDAFFKTLVMGELLLIWFELINIGSMVELIWRGLW